MKYSLLFYILFMGFYGIHARIHHTRSIDVENLSHNISETADEVITVGKGLVPSKDYPGCPMPPLECPNDNITFWYYSRALGDNPLPIRYTTSKSAGVDRRPGPWKVLIHGFSQSKKGFPVADLIAAYNELGDFNILVVEFDLLVDKSCFRPAVINMPLIAKCTGEMLDFLIDNKVFTSDLLHVIGFGMGAHIAGALFKYMDNNKLGRVTALDPFSINTVIMKEITVSEQSASFVDVFHTNALFKFVVDKVGHAEFFFNSGVVQPGCYQDEKEILSCSHSRSAKYFIESIQYNDSESGFYGIPCRSYKNFILKLCKATDETLAKVGEYADPEKRDTYYLQTNRHSPFALGKKYEFDPLAGF